MKKEVIMVHSNNVFNKEKFKQVLHYIISNVGSMDNVGKTVLYKMLYFSDFDYYELKEKSLTGETYVKLPRGPAPKDFDKVIQELEQESKIKAYDSEYCGKPQQKFSSLCQPKMDLLNGEEIQVIEKTIKKLSSMNATQISAYSHEDTPWRVAKDNEELNYEFVFYRNDLMSVTNQNQE